jgi:hypothetical protein
MFVYCLKVYWKTNHWWSFIISHFVPTWPPVALWFLSFVVFVYFIKRNVRKLMCNLVFIIANYTTSVSNDISQYLIKANISFNEIYKHNKRQKSKSYGRSGRNKMTDYKWPPINNSYTVLLQNTEWITKNIVHTGLFDINLDKKDKKKHVDFFLISFCFLSS